ncbi:MAG: NAD(P)H-dependent oxidoreductase [Planctomycetota bacterium]
MSQIRVVVISGSLRRGSFNTMLACSVAKHISGSDVTIDEISLSELDLPMFSEDLEKEGLPSSVLDLKARMSAADAMLIASPEYNGSVSGALKNAIDWATRPCEGEAPLQCFHGKVGALLAASPGRLGGIRGIRHLRVVLSSIGVLVIPNEFGLGAAHEAFDAEGSLKDESARDGALAVGEALVRTARALKDS